jgi:6-pyruvoyltetrahydropterin/6-carboxytetrahydropterin synthase
MPSYLLRVRSRFEAAHHLLSYRGQPEANHGHSFAVEVVLTAARLDEEGMAHDFVVVKEALDGLARQLDHRDLNELVQFRNLSPTTERIAEWFWRSLATSLPRAALAEVTVWEGPDCSATFRPDSSAVAAPAALARAGAP